MHARVFADFRHDRSHTPRDDLLRVRLPRIDHIVDSNAAAKVWWIRFGCFRRGLGGPEHVAVVVVSKNAVMKIETELAEFPELISDVFAGVRDSAVRADDDLV